MSPDEIEAIVDDLVRGRWCTEMVREKVEPLVVKLAGVGQDPDMSAEDIKVSVLEELCDPRKKWLAWSEAELRGWLSLDTWTVDEGLLLIANIDPEAAVVDGRGWVSTLGVKIKRVRILNARPLSRPPVFLGIPPPQLPQFSDYEPPAFRSLTFNPGLNAEEEELKWEKVSVLQELEERLNSIVRLWRSGVHDRKRYSARYFIEWAQAHSLQIPWLEQAREKGLLPVHLSDSDSVHDSHPDGSASEPVAAQPSPVKLINRNEVMAAFCVRPDPRENEKFWNPKLAKPSGWLEPARVIVGRPGESSLWNPLLVAHCLLAGYRERSYMSLTQLDAALHSGFPELYETWREETQDRR